MTRKQRKGSGSAPALPEYRVGMLAADVDRSTEVPEAPRLRPRTTPNAAPAATR